VQVLRELAEAVKAVREEASPFGTLLLQLPRSPLVVAGEGRRTPFPMEWDGHAPRARPAQPRARCASCSERANDVLTAVLAKMRSIERSSSREAFKVVGNQGMPKVLMRKAPSASSLGIKGLDRMLEQGRRFARAFPTTG